MHHDDPAVPMLRELGEPMYLMDTNPTAENIAKLIYDFTADQLTFGVNWHPYIF